MSNSQKQGTLEVVDTLPPTMSEEQASQKLTHLAHEMSGLANKSVEIYRAMLVHIRREQMTPPAITESLEKAGFIKQRITEIKRVALCSNEIFKEYCDNKFGFKIALQKARESSPSKSAKDKPEKATAPVLTKIPRDVEFCGNLVELLAEHISVKNDVRKVPAYLLKGLSVVCHGVTVHLLCEVDADASRTAKAAAKKSSNPQVRKLSRRGPAKKQATAKKQPVKKAA